MLEYAIISGVVGLVAGGGLASAVTAQVLRNKNKQRKMDLEKALSEIQGKTEKLTLLTGSMAQREQDLVITQNQLKEKESLLGKKDKEIAELQNQAKRQQVLLQEANENVHAKGQALEELQENLDQQTVTLQHREKELAETNSKLGETQQSLAAREQELTNLREEMQQKLEAAGLEQQDLRAQMQATIDEKAQQIERSQAEAERLNGEIEKWKSEQQKSQKTAEEYQEKSKLLSDEKLHINRLRAQAVHDLKRTLAVLESVAIPDDIKVEGEVEFAVEETSGTEELTVHLAEQEKLLREKEEKLQACAQQIVELQTKVKDLSETINLSGKQDAMLQEQARTLKKYEDQLVELGQIRAEVVDRDEKIKLYQLDLEKLQKQLHELLATQPQQQQPQAKDVDAKDAILQDPNLTMAHKKTMVMLYSQYTSPRKALKKQMEEGEKEETRTEAKEEPKTETSGEQTPNKPENQQ